MSGVPSGGRFPGQVVVITGSATGIGRATALRFASEGAAVACLDIAQEENEATTADALALGTQAVALTCDVRSRDEQEAAITAVVERWGRIDVLVACAGTYVGGPLPDIPVERWDDLVAVNLTGVLVSNSLVSPIMIKHGRGAIVNISSISALRPRGLTTYTTSKGAVIALTQAMAIDHGPDGIRVNCVAPGPVYTPMVYTRGMSDDARAARSQASILGVEGTGWDIGQATRFLLSDQARYITGQVLVVDGGVTLRSPERDSAGEIASQLGA